MNLPWIGAPLERSDARLKVTGGAQYAAEAPGIDPWYAHLVLSTIANGTVSHIETLGAEQVPGVVHVMTHANAMRVRYEKTSPYDHDLLVLQSDRIFHDRQPVAMVIAQTLEAAKEAAALVRVTYEAEKPLLDLHEAPQYKPDEVLEEDAQYLRGDPDAAFAAAPVKIRETYSTPWETHNPIEAHPRRRPDTAQPRSQFVRRAASQPSTPQRFQTRSQAPERPLLTYTARQRSNARGHHVHSHPYRVSALHSLGRLRSTAALQSPSNARCQSERQHCCIAN
jgi:CO/xanthine dehydrogenase Mo-binding subunit